MAMKTVNRNISLPIALDALLDKEPNASALVTRLLTFHYKAKNEQKKARKVVEASIGEMMSEPPIAPERIDTK